MIPTISQCALDTWRASGERTIARLRELVRLFAETHAGAIDHLSHYETEAIKAIRPWELEQ